MKQKPSSRKRHNPAKSILRLPGLEHAKAAVLNSLTSADPKGGYRHAIDKFVDWYCSDPLRRLGGHSGPANCGSVPKHKCRGRILPYVAWTCPERSRRGLATKALVGHG
jgi:hypothetical protein